MEGVFLIYGSNKNWWNEGNKSRLMRRWNNKEITTMVLMAAEQEQKRIGNLPCQPGFWYQDDVNNEGWPDLHDIGLRIEMVQDSIDVISQPLL